jgi:hypothetical protein
MNMLMPASRNPLITAGSFMFILWGILHILVGIIAAVAYDTRNPVEIFTAYGASLGPADSGPTLMLAANITLEFSIILAGYGVLSIWAALIMLRGQALGFWINTVHLGIVDVAFVCSLMIPGYIPISQGIWGPILYVFGVFLGGIGLKRPSTHRYHPEINSELHTTGIANDLLDSESTLHH